MTPTNEADSESAQTTQPPAISAKWLATYWVTFMSLSVLSFVAAVSQSRLAIGTALVLLAAFLGMVAVFAPIYFVAAYCKTALPGETPLDREPLRASLPLMIVSGVTFVVGAALAWWGVASEIQWLTAIGVLSSIHGGAFVSDSFNQGVNPVKHGAEKTFWWLVASVIILLLGTAVTALEGELTSSAAVATASALVALAVLKLTVVQFVLSEGDKKPLRAGIVWATAIASQPLGVIAALIDGWGGIVWAGTLLVGGLSVIGLLLHNKVSPPLPDALRFFQQVIERTVPSWVSRTVFAVGTAAFGLWSIKRLEDLSGSFAAALVVAGVIVLVGAFFVLPGETIFGALLVGLLVIWIAEDTDAPTVDAANAKIMKLKGASDGWIVALGDSYISGEGAPDFYRQTNTPGANTCRRAPTAYPALVGGALGMQVESFACSGAKTIDLLASTAVGDGQMKDSPSDVYGGDRQFDSLTAWLASEPRPDVDLVLLSIGGNDSGFTDVITSCLLPGADCSEVEGPFTSRVNNLGTELVEVYKELGQILLDAKFEGGAPPILVTPYPDPIGDGRAFTDDCNLMLSDVETPFIRRFRNELNSVVGMAIKAVSEADPSLNITLVPSDRALEGHELCESDAYINWLRLSPPDGNFLKTLNPTTWKNGSLHPGPDGHCVTSLFVIDAAVEAGFERIADDPDCSRPTTPGSSEPAAFLGATAAPVPEVCEDIVEPDECTAAWLDDAKHNAGAEAVLVVALGIAAGMFMGGAISLFANPQDTTRRSAPWSFAQKVWLEYDRVAGGPLVKPGDPNQLGAGSGTAQPCLGELLGD